MTTARTSNKQQAKISKTTTLHLQHSFLYISLHTLYDYNMNTLTHGLSITCTYDERVRLHKTKLQTMRSRFSGDIFLAVVSKATYLRLLRSRNVVTMATQQHTSSLSSYEYDHLKREMKFKVTSDPVFRVINNTCSPTCF